MAIFLTVFGAIEMCVNCLYFCILPTYRTHPLCKHGKFSRLRNSVFIIVWLFKQNGYVKVLSTLYLGMLVGQLEFEISPFVITASSTSKSLHTKGVAFNTEKN